MGKYTVNQLAKLAGVSVRTLHHYDEIGLLKPSLRTESKYRYYGEKELLRLQQILFYKELDLALVKIGEILDDPNFDLEEALRSHKRELLKRRSRTNELLKTIDKTITHLKSKNRLRRASAAKTMKAEDMYKGFSKEQAKAYEKEARETWGDKLVDRSKRRIKKLGKENMEKLIVEHEANSKALSELMHLDPADKKVQALIRKHYEFINTFYTPTPEVYKGLGDLYVNDERFRKTYEKYKDGLAEFMRKAMRLFSESLIK